MKRIPQNEIYRILSGLAGTVGLYVEGLPVRRDLHHQPGACVSLGQRHQGPYAGPSHAGRTAGAGGPGRPRTIDPRNRVGGTGILCELGTDYTPSLRDLAKLMIVLSDNIATNEIMDVIGMERFNSFCREMGYQNITLMRKMMDFEAIQQGKNNYMCAGETGRLLSAISRGEFVNPEISQTIFDIMASQQCRNKLPALLPAVASYSRLQVRHPGRAGPGGQQDRRPGGHPARRGHL